MTQPTFFGGKKCINIKIQQLLNSNNKIVGHEEIQIHLQFHKNVLWTNSLIAFQRSGNLKWTIVTIKKIPRLHMKINKLFKSIPSIQSISIY